jgi:hypothetical protein
MSESAKSIAEALWNVQKNLPTLGKDSTAKIPTKSGGEYSYKYVSLDHLMEKVLPLLNEHKLVLIQSPGFVSPESIIPVLRTKLIHYPSGEVHEDTMLLAASGTSPQDQGGAITYARRYALMAMLGLVADEDKDGAVPDRLPEGEKPKSTAQNKKIFALIKDLDTLKVLPPAPHADWKAVTEARAHEWFNHGLKDLTKDEASRLIEAMTAHVKALMEEPQQVETTFQLPGEQEQLVPEGEEVPF